MKTIMMSACLLISVMAVAQVPVNLDAYNKSNGALVTVKGNLINVNWPVGKTDRGQIQLDLTKDKALFNSIQMTKEGLMKQIAANMDPAFILTTAKRDLISQNGWNIFFDKVQNKPRQSFIVDIDKRNAAVSSDGSRTTVRISNVNASGFSGDLEITFYNGSPMFNVAAVMATDIDSTAIVYDAGLVSKTKVWNNISWADTDNKLQGAPVNLSDTSNNIAVKYRTIIGQSSEGSLALFPAPHQYFYPLDEAFNLKFTWYGKNYRSMIPEYGIGIRQDLMGDKRYVPWFNAPPKTRQRLNFFCYLSTTNPSDVLEEVKKFTHSDTYAPLAGYKTLSSHFHNEYIMKVVLAGKPFEEKPSFVNVFNSTGIDIVHLAEFHYTAHPKGPDAQRLTELKALHDMCERLSTDKFLLLPGEEPNEFFGGHWLDFFPKPVYWIMSRAAGVPFVEENPTYGKVYHIGDKNDMLKLLEVENGLAWTAHPRTKGSTGFPDKYKDEAFFKSDRFLGAAWKAMPADLSQSKLGNGRVLDLMDDMNNWGLKKQIISEADLFTIEPENEMYAHLNVNYIKLDELPKYSDGWQPILDVIRKGNYFSSTGEIVIPAFTVNGKGAGETVELDKSGKAEIRVDLSWTFPLSYAEIISGDGAKVYREKIDLSKTEAFGKQTLNLSPNLAGRKWVRVEVWDSAVNGAFSQMVWIK